jgi:hypothetical protein
MSTETSSPLMGALAELSRLYPEMRFGQLVELIVVLSSEETRIRAEDADDTRFTEAARQHMSLRRQQLGIKEGLPWDRPLPGPRAELLDLVLRVSEGHPEWRFGSLAEHLAACSGSSLYDAEDEQLIAAARRELAR